MNGYETIDREVRAAREDGNSDRLMEIYFELGQAEVAKDENAAAFLLVQALVYGLEAGRSEADEIHSILKKLGREE